MGEATESTSEEEAKTEFETLRTTVQTNQDEYLSSLDSKIAAVDPKDEETLKKLQSIRALFVRYSERDRLLRDRIRNVI